MELTAGILSCDSKDAPDQAPRLSMARMKPFSSGMVNLSDFAWMVAAMESGSGD